MTSTASSVNPAPEQAPVRRREGKLSDWFVPGLFATEFRRTWSIGFLFAILLFFAFPVAMMMNLDHFASYHQPAKSLQDFLSWYYANENPLLTLYAAGSAFLSAMVVMGYHFDRKKTNYVCALPVKRQAYFFTRCAVPFTWSLLAWMPAGLLLTVSVLVHDLSRPMFGDIMGGFMILFVSYAALYLYFYGLTLLASSFCGTGLISGGMTLMLGLYLPVFTATMIEVFQQLSNGAFYTDVYYSVDFFRSISGVFRIFSYIDVRKSASFLLCCAGLGLLYMAAAAFFVRIRKSEHAGTPFAFPVVREIVKYLCIVIAALWGGLLFRNMAYGWTYSWMVFGVICGVVLVWMLCNTVFFKTPRMMFYCKRGMAFMLAGVLLFSSLVAFDVFGLATLIPSPSATRSVTMNLGGHELVIRNPHTIAQMMPMLEKGQQLDLARRDKEGAVETMENLPEDTEAADWQSLLRGPFPTVIRTWFPIPLGKYTYMTEEDHTALVRTLTADPDFASQYFEVLRKNLEQADAEHIVSFDVSCDLQYPGENIALQYRNFGGRCSAKSMLALLSVFEEEMRSMGKDALQHRTTGDLNIRFDGRYYSFPLFASYEKTTEAVAALRKEVIEKDSYHSWEDERNSVYENRVIQAYVEYRGEKVRDLTEEECMALLQQDILTNGYINENGLTLVDPDYRLFVDMETTETYTDYDESKRTDVYTNQYELIFLEGTVPADYQIP